MWVSVYREPATRELHTQGAKRQGIKIKYMHKAVKWIYIACEGAENKFRIDLTCNVHVCVCECTVHECMYVLCTRIHFRNNASILYVYVLYVWQIYGVQAVYITMCVHKCVHSCTCTLCENSVKLRTQLMSLQVVRACVFSARVVCVCMCVCMCVCVTNMVYRLFT